MSIPGILALIILVMWLLVDNILILYRNRSTKVENRDRFSMLVITLGNLSALVLGNYLARYSWASIVPVLFSQVTGLIFMGLGLFLRFLAINQLGRFHTANVAVLKEHKIIETGLYRHVRHPSYLGALLIFFGFSLTLANWLSVLVIMSVSLCAYLYRIHEEETALIAFFGDAYRNYCLRTKRLIPKLY